LKQIKLQKLVQQTEGHPDLRFGSKYQSVVRRPSTRPVLRPFDRKIARDRENNRAVLRHRQATPGQRLAALPENIEMSSNGDDT